jgi:flavin reductase (DIM6/NTAB) family NADH-FMN oxidoreductase RutF
MAATHADLTRALGLLPSVPTVMTSAFENKRSGILIERIMRAADEPPCIAVSVPKGHRISTLVRDSHSFCLNLVDPKNRLLIKKFENGAEADAFELLESRALATGAPCLTRALACLDCDVMRHFDLESDHEVYIGQIMAAWIPGRPVVCTNGLAAAGANGVLNGHGPVVAIGAGGGGGVAATLGGRGADGAEVSGAA